MAFFLFEKNVFRCRVCFIYIPLMALHCMIGLLKNKYRCFVKTIQLLPTSSSSRHSLSKILLLLLLMMNYFIRSKMSIFTFKYRTRCIAYATHTFYRPGNILFSMTMLNQLSDGTRNMFIIIKSRYG